MFLEYLLTYFQRPRSGRTRTPEPEAVLKEQHESPGLRSGSEEGEIEEV